MTPGLRNALASLECSVLENASRLPTLAEVQRLDAKTLAMHNAMVNEVTGSGAHAAVADVAAFRRDWRKGAAHCREKDMGSEEARRWMASLCARALGDDSNGACQRVQSVFDREGGKATRAAVAELLADTTTTRAKRLAVLQFRAAGMRAA